MKDLPTKTEKPQKSGKAQAARAEPVPAEPGRAESLLRATLDATADGILVVDREGRVAGANRRFSELWGIPPEVVDGGEDDELLRMALSQLRDPEAFLRRVRELYSQPEAESFDTLALGDGRTFERYSRPQRLGDHVVGRVWSFRDVTGRVQAEAALRESERRLVQAQKMEVVGRLAGGVAHDFNNLLTIIGGNAQILMERLPAESGLARSARDIQKAAEHAAALTRRLLAFSHNQVVAPRVVDLHDVLRGSLTLLRRLLREDIQLDVALSPGGVHVCIDPVQVEQVLFNLAVNARDAMPDGGVLHLRTQVDDGVVSLIVTDTGMGMDSDTQARLFEPFFTTKGFGLGTGLGLATVREIVESSGGRVRVESSPGAGASFWVTLPAVEVVAEPAAPSRTATSPRGRAETILVVEDAADIRALVDEVLTDAGYRVLTAGDGEEALAVGARERPDLLLTDVVLPRLSGPDLYARLRLLRPGLRAVFMTGYADNVRGRPLPESIPHLPKPFRLDALVRSVRAALDGPAR